MASSDKDMVIGLLQQQLEKENRASMAASLDDPAEVLASQNNAARLVVAIQILEDYVWDDFEDDNDEIPF